MTPDDLARIRQRAEQATAGPWFARVKADAEFIAHARSDIPALLAEIEKLQRQIATLETSLGAGR